MSNTKDTDLGEEDLETDRKSDFARLLRGGLERIGSRASGAIRYLKNGSNQVIALFTAVIAITTGLQWGIARDQVSQTRAIIDQMRLEQRAWLSVQQVTIKDVKVGEFLPFSILIKNTGRTPATVSAAKTSIVIDPIGSDIGPRFDDIAGRERNAVIPPETRLTSPFIGLTDPLDQRYFDAIMRADRTHNLYVIGVVEYQDVFEVKRFTKFCFIYDPGSAEFVACLAYNVMN